MLKNLVITVTLSLLLKRHFLYKLCFASFCIKTVLFITVKTTFFGARCVWHHFVLKILKHYCFSKSAAGTKYLVQSAFCIIYCLDYMHSTVTLNLLLQRRVSFKLRCPSFCVKTIFVITITVTLNLLL